MRNKVIAFVIALCMLVTLPFPVVAGANEINFTEVITDMVHTVQRKDWNGFIQLMHSSEQVSYIRYFQDASHTAGIKQVETMFLKDIYAVEDTLAKEALLLQEYPTLLNSNTVKSYVVAVDCAVSNENQYFFNGLNYFFIVVVLESGQPKIVQFNRPTLNILETVVAPSLANNVENLQASLAGMRVIEQAENGLIVNAQNKILTENFTTISTFISDTSDYQNQGYYSTYSYPKLGHYSTYSYPNTIRVWLSQGNGSIVTVDFETYIKNTVPNEWYGSWETESLKAGALCAKMVGWYCTIKPVNSPKGYDTSQGTQKYKPNTEYHTTNSAVNAVRLQGMADSTGKIFFPEYAMGVSGQAGPQGGGQLKQWGSQYLATQGYGYKNILNYYYQGSVYSDGALVFFSYIE